jgi:hypothetical protein
VVVLMGGLLTLVTMYFVRGQRYAVDTETYSTVQRNTAVVLRKVSSDLYAATSKQLDVSPGEDAIWFLSSRPTAPDQPDLDFNLTTGKIFWRKWVCYYFDAPTERVIRAELALDTPDSELLAPPARPLSAGFFQTSPDVERQPVGRHVQAFRVSRTSSGVFVSVRTHAEAPLTNSNGQDRQVEVHLSSEVTMLN